MAGQNSTVVEAAADTDDGQGRQRSTISFPYADLNSAIALVQAIHGNVGLGDCDDAQLAAWTNQSVKSSTFRVQLAAARLFGLMATDGGGRHRLTDLGRMAIDPNRSREARARAFLMVPLFKAVFENYNGGVLPPAAALARDMVGIGVAEKTKIALDRFSSDRPSRLVSLRAVGIDWSCPAWLSAPKRQRMSKTPSAKMKRKVEAAAAAKTRSLPH